MKEEVLQLAAALVRRQRWAALATLGGEGPEASWVAYVADAQLGAVVMHLSRLAAHTRHLLADGRGSLAIGEPDDGARDDPQELARIALSGGVEEVGRDHPEYPRLRALYLGRLPAAEPRFDFGDFSLFRLVVREARLVGGFGRAYTLTPADLAAAGRLE